MSDQANEPVSPADTPKKPKAPAAADAAKKPVVKKPAEGVTADPAKKPAVRSVTTDPAKKPVAKKPAAPADGVTTDPDKKPVAKKPAAPADGITTEKDPAAPPPSEEVSADPDKKIKKKSEGIAKEPKPEKPVLKVVKAGVWGIDIGQCGLKAVRILEEDGSIVATAFDYIEHPKILSQPDADPDQLTREALEKFLSRNNLRGDTVCISVPGQSGLARFVKLPPVEEKKIPEIVRFEAKQQIPFNLEEVVWDYQKIGAGMVTDGFALDTEIGLFAMKRDLILRSLQHFIELGVEVHHVQMSPLALCNFVAYDLLNKGAVVPGEESGGGGEKKCVVALDIGADGSNLVITDGDRVIWQRPLPLGGNHFTRALTKDLKLTFAKAEHVKRNATKSPDLKKILASLKPVLNDFVSEVQRSIGYFTNTHRDAELEYIIGLGNAFRLPGLQRYLEEKLQIPVKKLQKLERISGDNVINEQVFTENLMTFGVAFGLALQGLEKSRLATNLLPNEIRVERLVKKKKPWAAAAAAVLLLGLGGYVLGYGIEYRAYSDKAVVEAEKASKTQVDAAASNQGKFASEKKNAENAEANVKSVIAGQDEHLNWLQLIKFISDAVPQPDGSNLNEKAREHYWEEKPKVDSSSKLKLSGRVAYDEFKKRQVQARTADPVKTPPDMLRPGERPGDKSASEQLPPFFSDLVQVNVEAIDTRYCEDLDAFWTYVRTREVSGRAYFHPIEQADKAPAGKKEGGWIVEIRGFTFHYEEQKFVGDVFAENIARLGMPDFDPKDPGKALPNRGPVINRISHVVVLASRGEVFDKKTFDTTNFKKISTSCLPDLLAAASQPAGAVGATPMAMPVVGSRGGRDSWVPVNGSGGNGRGPGGDRGGFNPSGNGGSTVVEDKDGLTRTEFVIVFIWKEPTPSDKLRGWDLIPAAAPPPAAAAPMPAPMPMPMPMKKD